MGLKKNHILFLTTTNLASNPRLAKEIRLAITNGFSATVIQFQLGNWSDEKTGVMEEEFEQVNFIRLSALRKPFLPWLISSLLEAICRRLPMTFMSDVLLSIAVSKRAYLLLGAIKKLEEPFSLVIAHNPGAFYPALAVAQKKGASLGIDVEDYHPGETNNQKKGALVKQLMQAVLPKATYCSYASPLIMEEVKKDIPELKGQQVVVLNGFEGREFFLSSIATNKEALQLIWFSQNINANRGLEKFIPVVNELYPAIELHLIGNLDPVFASSCLQNRNGIILHGSLAQKELHQFLSKCDIGLALDIPVDRNRDLALTNKILAYIQAGLFIVATHTSAQDAFLQSNGLAFEQMDNEQESIRTCLQHLIEKKEGLRENKGQRFLTGRQYDWESISGSLVNIWKN